MRYTDLFEADAATSPKALPLTHKVFEPMLARGEIQPAFRYLADLHGSPESVKEMILSKQPYLHSLEGGPSIVHGDCFINETPITSLQGGPTEVDGVFSCVKTNITSLIGGPQKVGEKYALQAKGVKSLEGVPSVLTKFEVSNTPIANLVGGPNVVTESYMAHTLHALQSYEGAPKDITGMVWLTLLPSLKNFHKFFPKINGRLQFYPDYRLETTPPTNLLSLFLVQGLTQVSFNHNPELGAIITKNLAHGKNGMMSCAAELVMAGYKEQAKL